MNWDIWIQLVLAMFAGAWIYSRGVKSDSIVPGAKLAEGVTRAVAERIANRNGQKPRMPELPRVGA